ncbi:MAG: RNA polymerase sigma factor [Odoribacter sp.]|nr:RNA polymerase sigma factor [Odoribacter sp.]
MVELSDDKIMRLISEGRSETAFRLIVSQYGEQLYWRIRKIVVSHEDSNDVLQNVYVKIWRGLGAFRFESKLSTWMHRIATNEALNFINEKRRKVYGNQVEIGEMLANTLESDTYINGNEMAKKLQMALFTLSERQRLIFNMRYFEDMTNEAVAEELGVAVGTIKATYHQAVKKIEELLKDR